MIIDVYLERQNDIKKNNELKHYLDNTKHRVELELRTYLISITKRLWRADKRTRTKTRSIQNKTSQRERVN